MDRNSDIMKDIVYRLDGQFCGFFKYPAAAVCSLNTSEHVFGHEWSSDVVIFAVSSMLFVSRKPSILIFLMIFSNALDLDTELILKVVYKIHSI